MEPDQRREINCSFYSKSIGLNAISVKLVLLPLTHLSLLFRANPILDIMFTSPKLKIGVSQDEKISRTLCAGIDSIGMRVIDLLEETRIGWTNYLHHSSAIVASTLIGTRLTNCSPARSMADSSLAAVSWASAASHSTTISS